MKFILTVDADFPEYYENKLPSKGKFVQYLEEEVHFCKECVDGKFIHLIHFSPLSEFYFLDGEFIPYYKRIEQLGGNVGVHFHMDIPLKKYNLFNLKVDFMNEALTRMKHFGLRPIAHRGGFFSYDNVLTKLLENHGIRLEMSNVVGRKMVYNDQLVSDWSGAINKVYRLDYDDFKQPGASDVWEIPVGNYNNRYLYLEKITLDELASLLINMRRSSDEDEDRQIFTVVTHSYMFTPLKYTDSFRPFDNPAFNNKYLTYLSLMMKRIDECLPIVGNLVSKKQYSFRSIYNRKKFRAIIEKIRMDCDFISGDECMEMLQ